MTERERLHEVLREYRNAKVLKVGKPRVRIGHLVAAVVSAGVVSAVAFASGDFYDPTTDLRILAERTDRAVDVPIANASTPSGAYFLPVSDTFDDLLPKGWLRPSNPPHMAPVFFDVAADAIRHNAGVTIETAEEMLDYLEDEGQHCANDMPRNLSCTVTMYGVVLDYDKQVFTVTYDRFSKDGMTDLGDRRVGAVQRGEVVEVIAEPHRRDFPVPPHTP